VAVEVGHDKVVMLQVLVEAVVVVLVRALECLLLVLQELLILEEVAVVAVTQMGLEEVAAQA